MTYGRPVIAMSSWTEDSSLISRAKLAADFYLQMPFKIDAFLEAFEKCLEMLVNIYFVITPIHITDSPYLRT